MKSKKDIFETILLGIMVVFFVFTLFNTVMAKKEGREVTLFGYRPIVILTGSMEPTIMTNGMAITKNVDSMDDIKEGDIITFHVENEDGKMIRVTHRINEIMEDGSIITKGDNNNVTDSIPLTMENVDAKVVCIMNFTATIINMWNRSINGKIIIICTVLFILIGGNLIKVLTSKSKDAKTN